MAGPGVLVITGGSRGIGAQTARLAAAAGWDVAVNYRENRENRAAAEAVEIAKPIVWLLSDEASFISGACLDASGGGFLVR